MILLIIYVPGGNLTRVQKVLTPSSAMLSAVLLITQTRLDM